MNLNKLITVLCSIVVVFLVIVLLSVMSLLYGNMKPLMKFRHVEDSCMVGTGYFGKQINVGDTTYYGITKVIIIEK